MLLRDFLNAFKGNGTETFIFLKEPNEEERKSYLEDYNGKKYFRIDLFKEDLTEEPKFKDYSNFMTEDKFKEEVLESHFKRKKFLDWKVKEFSLEESWSEDENWQGEIEYSFSNIEVVIILEEVKVNG